DIIALNVETLHHHCALRLKVEQFARSAGSDDLDALVVGAGIDDDGVATVEGVCGFLDCSPRRSRCSRIRIAPRRRYVVGSATLANPDNKNPQSDPAIKNSNMQ